jgi:pimeloyl-ACP methyl ester carboxylesterase
MSIESSGDYDDRVKIRGDGMPLVLVPGLDGTGQLYHRQAALLARGYRVATYALRDAATSMQTLVDDLGRVVDAVAGESGRAIVIGESFGGGLSLTFALAQPERVRALVIINSFPYFAPRFRLNLAIYGLKVMPWGAMPLARRLTAFRLHSKHTHQHEVHDFIAVTRSATKEGYLGRLRLLTRYDVRHRLSDLVSPTLFVASELDHLVPSLEQARYMVERVPGATLKVLEGHGHICLIAPDLDLSDILHEWRDGRW